jgi:hypothetical protein
MTLSGCALWPWSGSKTADVQGHDAQTLDDLAFLDRAMDGNAATREALWKDTLAAPHSRDTALRVALLQSVPDHPAYDPAAAQRGLRAVLAQNPPPAPSSAALARVRLDDLKSSSQCLSETQDLRRRLAQVVNIERQLDGTGH